VSSRNPTKKPPSDPIFTHQATDASAAPSVSYTAHCSRGVISGPPHAFGIAIRKAPAVFSFRTRSAGSRRNVAISSPRD
jgi:hypothetical protein